MQSVERCASKNLEITLGPVYKNRRQNPLQEVMEWKDDVSSLKPDDNLLTQRKVA